VVPLLLGAVSALEPNFVWPMLLADLAVAALAASMRGWAGACWFASSASRRAFSRWGG
jgi:hypothetical protein